MDRRVRKTREAIFSAFTELLASKDYSRVTVGEIIDRADVGRATFYAHFETKDHLLKALCEELFCHVFDSAMDGVTDHRHIFICDVPDSVFLHLIKHLQKNDNNILKLMTSRSGELFFCYFKSGVKRLVAEQIHQFENSVSLRLPEDFRINHISSTFVETIKWWIDNGMKQSPETLAEYFYLAL